MSALPDPYGSYPGRPARYVLYVTRHGDDDTQCIVVAFAEPYAARKFLDVLLADDGIVWDHDASYPTSSTLERGATIRSETGVVVSTRWWPKLMRQCVEHEYTLAEMAWTLDKHYADAALRFRNGPDLPRTIEEDRAAQRSVERREKREARASSPRTPRDDLVTVADVALSLGVDARQARVALRSLKLPKPAAGWAWPASEVDAIRERIRGAL